MVTPSYTIRCTRKKVIAPGVYELAFEKPKGFTFKGGQFVLFDVPLLSNPADIQPRAYSISSAPHEDELLFVVKIKPGGRFSEWMEKALEVGMEASIKGPLGLFTLRPGTKDIFLIATGAGVAPFRSHLLEAAHTNDKRNIHLLFGCREQKDFFWVHTFHELAAKKKNFHIHLCLSGVDNAWVGHKGRVQTKLRMLVKNPENADIYVSGAPEMVKDVKTMALEELKVPKANVHGEGYI